MDTVGIMHRKHVLYHLKQFIGGGPEHFKFRGGTENTDDFVIIVTVGKHPLVLENGLHFPVY